MCATMAPIMPCTRKLWVMLRAHAAGAQHAGSWSESRVQSTVLLSRTETQQHSLNRHEQQFAQAGLC